MEDLAGVFGAGENAVDLGVVRYGYCGDIWGLLAVWGVLPFTDICFLYSSWVCSRMGLEIAIPVEVH